MARPSEPQKPNGRPPSLELVLRRLEEDAARAERAVLRNIQIALLAGHDLAAVEEASRTASERLAMLRACTDTLRLTVAAMRTAAAGGRIDRELVEALVTQGALLDRAVGEEVSN